MSHEKGSAAGTAAGIAAGIVGGLAGAALAYWLFGPRCPECNALIRPRQQRCGNCGIVLIWE